MEIPPGFEADFIEAQQLEAQRHRNPQATVKLIKVYEQIIERLQSNEYPIFYATIQSGLGRAYYERLTGDYDELLTGDRLANLQRAVECYQEALRFFTPETAPLDYARIQSNLGFIYWRLPTGDRWANRQQAIRCFQEALRFLSPEATPLDYARVQNRLGVISYEWSAWNADHDKLPIQSRAPFVEQAIAFFQEALRFFTPADTPLDYARVMYNLGNACSELPTGDRSANLQQAITHYQKALRFLSLETFPLDCANTQLNLGAAYANLSRGDRSANLQQAITCYWEALRFFTPETMPFDYALIQNNLGIAYQGLPTGDRSANLQQAIACYQEALRFRTPDTIPLAYARTLNNLGTAYKDMIGDRSANLQQAIACYQEALRFQTPEAVPFDYAMTQHNLGGAYYLLPTGDRSANLQQAIACYREALRFWTPEHFPLDYALTQDSLGNVYVQLQTGSRATNLQRAIACYQEALRFFTPESTPFDYAATQHNLGNAYKGLPTGDRSADLRQAIACYQEALRSWTPENFPFHYAVTQYNLGNVYGDLPEENHATNLQRAIASYQEALRFFTPETSPFECRTCSRNLAALHFDQGEWIAALHAYRVAVDVGEQLYRAGLSTESRAIEVVENALLHRYAAFSAIRCGEKGEALRLLEQGKTRLLMETLRLRVPRPAHVPDDVWCLFEGARATVSAAQSARNTILRVEHDLIQAYEFRMQSAQEAEVALKAAIEHVRAYDPTFLQEVDLPAMLALLADKHIALVDLCITDQGSIGFVMDNSHDQDIQIVEVPNFDWGDLHRLISDWQEAYDRYRRERTQTAFTAWQETITETLAQLGQRLLTPLLSSLSADIQKIIFLLSAELFLLPLHAAPLSDAGSALVCDRYQISYAPSIEVLANTRAKAVQRVTPKVPNLYAVVNPSADLALTSVEGAAITRLFTECSVDEGRTGTRQHVIDGVQGRGYIHFACSGSYNWNDPPESGLVLADGRLTLDELQHGEVNLSSARLVTLSACETGIVDVTKGNPEEYVGIPAGFLLAGVLCVVSSLWEVPDLSTALLMERFYRNHLKGKMDFAEALCEAQQWVRELSVEEVVQYAERWYRQPLQKDKKIELFKLMRYYRYQAERNPALRPFAHPYYWAAFTVNGI